MTRSHFLESIDNSYRALPDVPQAEWRRVTLLHDSHIARVNRPSSTFTVVQHEITPADWRIYYGLIKKTVMLGFDHDDAGVSRVSRFREKHISDDIVRSSQETDVMEGDLNDLTLLQLGRIAFDLRRALTVIEHGEQTL